MLAAQDPFSPPSHRNWLRDYSQAVDIAGLKKLQLQTIVNLCMALGFLAHGYATHEFEVTEDRLGVYLPVRLAHTNLS